LLKDVFAITASMVPLAVVATDVGDNIIEVEGFIVASSFLCNNVIVIIDRSHWFMPIFFFGTKQGLGIRMYIAQLA